MFLLLATIFLYTFFTKRYGNRALVLETVATVRGMVDIQISQYTYRHSREGGNP